MFFVSRKQHLDEVIDLLSVINYISVQISIFWNFTLFFYSYNPRLLFVCLFILFLVKGARTVSGAFNQRTEVSMSRRSSNGLSKRQRYNLVAGVLGASSGDTPRLVLYVLLWSILLTDCLCSAPGSWSRGEKTLHQPTTEYCSSATPHPGTAVLLSHDTSLQP